MGRAEDAIRDRQRQQRREAERADTQHKRDMQDAYCRLLDLIGEWTPAAITSLDESGWPDGELVPVGLRRVRNGLLSWRHEPIEEAAVKVGGVAPEGREIAYWGSSRLFADGTWMSTSPYSTQHRGTFHETVLFELQKELNYDARKCVEARLRGVPESLRRYATGTFESFGLPAIQLPYTSDELLEWTKRS